MFFSHFSLSHFSLATPLATERTLDLFFNTSNPIRNGVAFHKSMFTFRKLYPDFPLIRVCLHYVKLPVLALFTF